MGWLFEDGNDHPGCEEDKQLFSRTGEDIEQVKKEYGSRVCLIGNIDLSYTLVNGTIEEVKNEVRSRIEKIGYNGGYILSSANSITSYCKTENILAMRDALLEYGHD